MKIAIDASVHSSPRQVGIMRSVGPDHSHLEIQIRVIITV